MSAFGRWTEQRRHGYLVPMKSAISQMDNAWLGKRLRRAREKAGIRLERAGVEIDKSAWTVRAYERGMVPANWPTIAALANLYGVTVAEMLTDDRAA